MGEVGSTGPDRRAGPGWGGAAAELQTDEAKIVPNWNYFWFGAWRGLWTWRVWGWPAGGFGFGPEARQADRIGAGRDRNSPRSREFGLPRSGRGPVRQVGARVGVNFPQTAAQPGTTFRPSRSTVDLFPAQSESGVRCPWPHPTPIRPPARGPGRETRGDNGSLPRPNRNRDRPPPVSAQMVPYSGFRHRGCRLGAVRPASVASPGWQRAESGRINPGRPVLPVLSSPSWPMARAVTHDRGESGSDRAGDRGWAGGSGRFVRRLHRIGRADRPSTVRRARLRWLRTAVRGENPSKPRHGGSGAVIRGAGVVLWHDLGGVCPVGSARSAGTR